MRECIKFSLQCLGAAKVSVPTVKRAEGSGRLSASSSAEAALRQALRDNGIQFLKSGEVAKGDGVALKSEDWAEVSVGIRDETGYFHSVCSPPSKIMQNAESSSGCSSRKLLA